MVLRPFLDLWFSLSLGGMAEEEEQVFDFGSKKKKKTKDKKEKAELSISIQGACTPGSAWVGQLRASSSLDLPAVL